MTKRRLIFLVVLVALAAGLAGPAAACPSCDAPWLWTATPCKPTNCSPCGWQWICNGGPAARPWVVDGDLNVASVSSLACDTPATPATGVLVDVVLPPFAADPQS